MAVNLLRMLSASRQIVTLTCFSGSDCVEAFLRETALVSDKTATLTQNITTIESEFPWCEVPDKGDVVCLAGFRVHPERKDVMNTMLLQCKEKCMLLAVSAEDMRDMLVEKTSPHLGHWQVCCRRLKILSSSCTLGMQGTLR